MRIVSQLCRAAVLSALAFASIGVAQAAPRDHPLACTSDIVKDLPTGPSPPLLAPFWSGSVMLYGADSQGWASGFATMPFHRQANVVTWRRGCGSGTAALMMRVQDVNDFAAPRNLMFPKLIAFQDGQRSLLVAESPNGSTSVTTLSSYAIPDTYVLRVQSGNADLKRAFKLQVSDGVGPDAASAAGGFLELNIPTLDTDIPRVEGPGEIAGRYSGNFYDPAHPGEGVIVEVGAQAGRPEENYLQFAWFTFDNDGRPFWLGGGASFSAYTGATHLHAPAAYRTGGRFAGAKAADQLVDWGTVDFEFTDCNTLQLDYAAKAGLPSGVPVGSGHMTLKRLTTIKGYSCD